MLDRKVKRREFVKLSSLAVLGAAAACTPQAQPQPEPAQDTAPTPVPPTQTPVVVEKEVQVEVTVEVPKGVPEPPQLAERVKSGQLPPLAERLPVDPLVVTGREAIGVYGGEMRMTHYDAVWIMTYDFFAERMLHYSDMDLRTIVPNIFESWEVTPDGKTFTFTLRKGMKWSDGAPVTVEDVRFWWEDVILDPDLSGGPSWEFRFGGEPMKAEFIDDFTFRFTFAAPFGNFAAHLTRWHPTWNIMLPAHYLSKFHAKYVDKAELDKMAKDQGMDDWVALFWKNNGWGTGVWQAPDNFKEHPTLAAWIVVNRTDSGVIQWERNPYYWKVDMMGNQLPYIDNIRHDMISNVENLKLKIVQNEIDYAGPHEVTIADYPVYKENETRGNYIVADYLSCMTDRYVLLPSFNLADDPVLEEIVNHPNFLKALSHAIDRDEVNESLFFGMASMGQLAPMPNSKYYKPKYGTAWADYDPDKANQLLDEMGLDQRNAQGFRLRPDGQVLKYNIEHTGERVGAATDKYTEIVTTFWREVGIEASTKQIAEALWRERMANGQVHCGIWHNDRCTDMLIHVDFDAWYLPGAGDQSYRWKRWLTAPTEEARNDLEAPPEAIIGLHEAWAKMRSTVDENERVAYAQEVLDYTVEHPWGIGLVLECPAPLIVNKNLRNLPRPKVPVGWDTWGLSTYHPEALFYEGGQRA
jgi:peptide/nickel transport system substrate-binding protein